jgi:netrin-G3 ligand
MREEGVVDLQQTVRQLREQRHQMVETLEEYAFCYEAAEQYFFLWAYYGMTLQNIVEDPV